MTRAEFRSAFPVGSRVRLLSHARRWAKRGRVGTVKSYLHHRIPGEGNREFHWVRVARDGIKTVGHWHMEQIELVPLVDFTADEAADALVRAFQAGDRSAALGLADRVMELCGGTPPAAKPDLRAIAEAVATRLFTNGRGEVGVRLALEKKNDTHANVFGLGGWGFGPAVDQIEDVLRKAFGQ